MATEKRGVMEGVYYDSKGNLLGIITEQAEEKEESNEQGINEHSNDNIDINADNRGGTQMTKETKEVTRDYVEGVMYGMNRIADMVEDIDQNIAGRLKEVADKTMEALSAKIAEENEIEVNIEPMVVTKDADIYEAIDKLANAVTVLGRNINQGIKCQTYEINKELKKVSDELHKINKARK